MIKKWIENLTFTASNDDQDVRRKHMRRKTDTAVASIENKNFPIENWSEGGVLICADEKDFSISEPIQVKMKFKLSDRVVEIEQLGKIVRKNFGRVAVQFAPLTAKSASQFQNIVADAVTREFVESQTA